MEAFAGCSIVTVVDDKFTLYKDLIMKVWFWHTKFNGIDMVSLNYSGMDEAISDQKENKIEWRQL